jgi:acetyl esterase/lipase
MDQLTVIRFDPLEQSWNHAYIYTKLDVYYPANVGATAKVPVLFWIYGGGFVRGDRNLPAPRDLTYSNVGTYFAQRGFLTIIPDYRLAPGVQFPEPHKDVYDAVRWAVKGIPQEFPQADTEQIFLMGHSAGASHVITATLHAETAQAYSDIRPRIAGLCLFAGPYHPTNDFAPSVEAYWGGIEKAKANSALGLLHSASDEIVSGLPPMVFLEAEREPEWLRGTRINFQKALRESRGIPDAPIILAKGHNHISPPACLQSGQGEEWAETVVQWIQGVLAKNAQK